MSLEEIMCKYAMFFFISFSSEALLEQAKMIS